MWFSEPLGILSADSRTLRCYHTPEMQEIVRTVVERFVDSDAEQHVVGLRLVMIGGTNWRARALSLMDSGRHSVGRRLSLANDQGKTRPSCST